MANVLLVTHGDYDAYEVIGVCKDRAAVDSFIDRLCEQYRERLKTSQARDREFKKEYGTRLGFAPDTDRQVEAKVRAYRRELECGIEEHELITVRSAKTWDGK